MQQIMLMVQKSGVHQLRLVVFLIIYKVLAPSQVVVWGFFHQQSTSGNLNLIGDQAVKWCLRIFPHLPCLPCGDGRYLEDHPRTCKWLITMVSKSLSRVLPLPNGLNGL